MNGLGDSIYQRPYVRELARTKDVYMTNSWPQLYADLPVKFVRHPLRLRTQEKNVRTFPPDTFVVPPAGIRRQYLGYNLEKPEDNILTGLDRMAPPPNPFVFDLPPMPSCPVETDRPIAVVRPVTERGEWLNRARNCHPKYVAMAAAKLRAEGFFVVSVADLQAGIEIAFNPLPPADLTLHKGELDVTGLMALIRDAAVVVGPIGWILPAALVYGTPIIVIAGGHGSYNRPDRLTDPRLDTSALRWILPAPFCRPCANMLHRCNKIIPGFDHHFARALDEVLAAREAVAA